MITLRGALQRGDLDTVEALGHRMKGAGASFGFQVITDLGAALEDEAGRADAHSVRRSVDALVTFLDRVAPAPRPSRRIVLVVDDDDLRICFRQLLEGAGHHVDAASGGVEGLALILAARPEVAVIDIGMPGMDGYEVARRTRSALGASVLLVALTGHGRDRDRADAFSAGFDRHVTKPVDEETFTAMFASG